MCSYLEPLGQKKPSPKKDCFDMLRRQVCYRILSGSEKLLLAIFYSRSSSYSKSPPDVVGADAITSGVAQGKLPWLLIARVVLVGIALALLVRYAARKLTDKQKTEAENAYN